MNTIQTFDEDASAQGRLNAWWLTWNVAVSHFFGGGYKMYTPEVFAVYAPNPLDVHVAHSIYFSVLGEHGIVGLILFLAFWASTWHAAGWIERNPRVAATDGEDWARVLAAMIKVSIVGYLVGGAFLSLAYFDLPYYLMALAVILRAVVNNMAPNPVPERRPPPTHRPLPSQATGTK